MHMDTSQEPVYARICRKNARSQMGHPYQAPAFTLTGRTPQCEHTVWGISKHLYKCYTRFLKATSAGQGELDEDGNEVQNEH